MKPAKILYFIDGPTPSADDMKAANDLKGQIVFRNAKAVPSSKHALEVCDGVAGDVPAVYKAKYPTAEDAIAKKAAELDVLAKKAVDVAPAVIQQTPVATESASTAKVPAVKQPWGKPTKAE